MPFPVLPFPAFHAKPRTYSIEFGWNAIQDPSIKGYKVFQGVVSGSYTNCVNAYSNTLITITNLPKGTNYFAATAYNELGLESDYSDELMVVLPFQIMKTNTIITINYTLSITNPLRDCEFFRVQSSIDLNSWSQADGKLQITVTNL